MFSAGQKYKKNNIKKQLRFFSALAPKLNEELEWIAPEERYIGSRRNIRPNHPAPEERYNCFFISKIMNN